MLKKIPKYLFLLLLIISVDKLLAQESPSFTVSGTILNDSDPISFATVVIQELEIVEYSDDEGNFVIPEVPAGEYTLIIIADGFEEKNFPLIIDANYSAQTYQLADAVDEEIFQEEIIVTSERFEDSTSSQQVYSEIEVENLPLINDDPTSIVANESGIVFNNNALGGANGSQGGRVGGGKLYSFSRDYSLYGGESFWNRYYYGNIQIPTNFHVANPQTSIITRKAVGTITSFKGMPKGIYGQGIGGTIALEPKISKKKYILIDASLTDPTISFNYLIMKDLSIFSNVRYSIAEFTIVPLANAIAETTDSSSTFKLDKIRYGDAIVGLEYNPPGHDLKVLLFGFFDDNKLEIGRDDPDDTLSVKPTNKPLFGAVGVSWDMIVGEIGKNSLTTYFTAYKSTTDFLIESTDKLSTIKYGYEGFIETKEYKILDSFDWYINENNLMSFGLEFQILTLFGKHEDIFESADAQTTQQANNQTKFELEENLYKLYSYAEYSWAKGIFETSFTAGVSQLLHPTSEYKTFPSALTTSDVNFAPRWKLSFSASISPSFLEATRMTDKLISERLINYSNKSSYSKPTYGFTTIPKLTWQVTNEHSLFFEPFFAYYFNFSGFHSGLIVNNVVESSRGYKYLTPDRGLSAGGALIWKWNKDNKHILDISYTLGYALYDTPEYGWMAPENDYRHQFKASYILNLNDYFSFSLSSYVFVDKPFTPYTLVLNQSKNPASAQLSYLALTREFNTPNSARSYIPEFSLIASVQGHIIKKSNWQFKYRFQPGNLLGWLFFSETELVNESLGASSKDAENRKIDVNYGPAAVFANLLLSFEFVIQLP